MVHIQVAAEEDIMEEAEVQVAVAVAPQHQHFLDFLLLKILRVEQQMERQQIVVLALVQMVAMVL